MWNIKQAILEHRTHAKEISIKFNMVNSYQKRRIKIKSWHHRFFRLALSESKPKRRKKNPGIRYINLLALCLALVPNPYSHMSYNNSFDVFFFFSPIFYMTNDPIKRKFSCFFDGSHDATAVQKHIMYCPHCDYTLFTIPPFEILIKDFKEVETKDCSNKNKFFFVVTN